MIVYGDSFADCRPNAIIHGEVKHWFHFIYEHYTGEQFIDEIYPWKREAKPYINRGKTGTSQAYSYYHFKQDIEKYNIEKVIFLFSSPRRAPIDSGPMAGYSHTSPNRYIRSHIKSCHKDDQKEARFQYHQIDCWFRYFVNETTAISLMQQSIFDQVQKECKKRNIQLVFLICYNEELEPIQINTEDLEYPIIINLERVSLNEIPSSRGTPFVNFNDMRVGHMNMTNNQICADEIIKCFNDQSPRIIKFDEVNGFDYSEETFNFYDNLKTNKYV